MTADRATLLLLPGLDGSAKLFGWFVRQMPREQRAAVVAYPEQAGFDLDALADIAQSAMPQNVPIVVVAESFSGAVALRLLKRKLPDIVGAVFVASFARTSTALLQLRRFLPIRILALLRRNESVLRAFCLDRDAPADVVHAVSEVLNNLSIPVLENRLDLLLQLNETALLDQINIPVLCLSAKRDRLVAQNRWLGLSGAIAGSTTQSIDGPHFLLQTRPAECWRAISDWLATTTHAA